jgi:CubicO group peptidase (beta-lactamase class C family)
MKEGSAKPYDLNTIMWVASCTKLMTSISAMQLVERGLVTLDEPIYKHIPELEKLKVLTGFDESTGAPIEEKQNVTMTLRHLLTHASGLSYDGMHPKLLAWLAYHKQKPNQSGKLLERFTAPLVAQPGESWAYGPSIDYAGLLVERLSGKSLEDYMKENLWEPLGIKDMTFFLSKRPDMKARQADMSIRNEEGKVRFTEGGLPYVDGDGNEVQDCMGGQGCFTSAEEYVKVLQAILTTDENEKVLKKASVEEFFKPQLGKGSSGMLNMVLQDDMVCSLFLTCYRRDGNADYYKANNAMGGTSKSVKKDWGLGGILLVDSSEDSPFEAGTMLWGGYPNLIWVCRLLATFIIAHH